MAFNQYNRNLLISQLNDLLDTIRKMPATISCNDCAHYKLSGNAGKCRLADMTPPPEVIEKGCESYQFDPSAPPF